MATQDWLGVMLTVTARHSMAGMDRIGGFSYGVDEQGKAGQARIRSSACVREWYGTVRQGEAG